MDAEPEAGRALASSSTYRALSKEHKNKDGYKTSGLVIDRLHMQADRKLWDVLIYGGRTGGSLFVHYDGG